MPSTLKTPGVYIEEINAFPGSAVAVDTALPVFIGYTEKADRKGKSLIGVPTRVTSFAEYVELFGQGFNHRFNITKSGAAAPPDKKAAADAKAPAASTGDQFKINGENYNITIKNSFYFYNSIRLFYQNGGSNCYIMAIGTYGNNPAAEVKLEDFNESVFKTLEKEFEPTLVVMPDIVSKGSACYSKYLDVLKHCNQTQSRFGIFDVVMEADTPEGDILKFRTEIGTSFLNYGAAYYPWLKTSVVASSELSFENLDAAVKLGDLLPEADAKSVLDKMKELADEKKSDEDKKTLKTSIHQSLLAVSPSYGQIMEELRSKLNLLPPSGAMAGIYTLIDNSRGVWKSPANVSLAYVNAPSLNISHGQQENMNVDAISGKSINIIRPFPGIGTLVWGARTLDGNSQDWRYINVRRTMIMIEQSLKLACRAYVFEPNDSGTWVTLRSMINNFLFNLWKMGALAGAAPEQAYDVQVGLGSTMTPTDILDGILRISVKVAVVRPAEFIVITFQQLQQQS